MNPALLGHVMWAGNACHVLTTRTWHYVHLSGEREVIAVT
jgi:hypothetical protein